MLLKSLNISLRFKGLSQDRGYHHWTNTGLVCTHLNTFVLLNPNMIMTIWISKFYEKDKIFNGYHKTHWTNTVIKLDSLSPIHRFIGQAMSWGKYWARRYVEPNIFPTHGETNKFVYWMKSRIQFYHYYVFRIFCPISLYTFLNKQISNKREKKCKLTYQLWYPNLFSV